MGSVDSKALALCIVFPILSILAVIARFRARSLKKQKIAADDWLILPALLFAIGNAVNVLIGATTANLGQHIPLDKAGFAAIGPKLIALEKMTYASEPIVTIAITLARLSILLFYIRIFTTSIPAFRVAAYTMCVVNVAWGIAFTFAYLFQCIPVNHFWTQPQGERTGCINIAVNYYYAVSTIIIDVLVLTIPWPVVWNLRMARKQKIAISGIFMLGAIVVAASIGKCYAFFTIGELLSKDHDVTYHEGPLFYWTVPECCLSVVCACLPTLRPIFHGWSPESLMGSVRSALSLSSLHSARDSTRRYATGWENHTNTYQSSVGLRKASTEPRSSDWTPTELELADIEQGNQTVKAMKS